MHLRKGYNTAMQHERMEVTMQRPAPGEVTILILADEGRNYHAVTALPVSKLAEVLQPGQADCVTAALAKHREG